MDVCTFIITDADSAQWVPATPESGVDIAPDGGLETDADGLKIKLKPNGGLQNTADGLVCICSNRLRH